YQYILALFSIARVPKGHIATNTGYLHKVQVQLLAQGCHHNPKQPSGAQVGLSIVFSQQATLIPQLRFKPFFAILVYR
ncbi:MAG TPA: hypothetical protein PKC68_07870, partial [Alphaproteobacteria bacterium]|nr:hypothetical protein [Alphaproteobacteria bacterium]